MNRFHFPPSEFEIDDSTPLVFLAGPVRGTSDWQRILADQILSHRDDIEVASPRRQDDIDFLYKQQVEWEKRQLTRSAKFGSVAFWFASQDPNVEYEPGRAYAQTSRIEIGRLFGWYDYNPFPLVVGFDPSYTENGGGNQRYIESMCDEKGLQVACSLDELASSIVSQTPTKLG